MTHPPGSGLTVALALGAGMLAQALARHLRIPGIVLLLPMGVLLGPDGAGLVQPGPLGSALAEIVGFAVAVILFEGGMSMDLRRLRQEARGIRQIVTFGSLVTAVTATLAARLVMGFGWSLSTLFGTLVIVTGPTVIQPLLRRLRLAPRVSTLLEAEAVLGDPIGALVAVMALEVVLALAGEGSGLAVAGSVGTLVLRLGFGVAAGVAGGLAIAGLLRLRRVVPEGLENVLTLSLALVLFEACNAAQPESGIAAATAAGMVVGNVRTRKLDDLREFKEQLTVLLIGLLFVLLAANVRLGEVRALGVRGALTVATMMFVVRPLNVLASTWRTDVTGREKLLLMWIAPRGIVAAAVSSLFARELDAAHIPGGAELRALVFLLIATTVTLQGLSGGLVASALGLRRKRNHGYAVLGANELARAVARALQDGGEEVVLIDANPEACHAAQAAGFRVLHGSGLNERVLLAAGVDARAGCLGVTPNDDVNLVFGRTARGKFHVPRVWIAVRRSRGTVTPRMLEPFDGRLLFGEPRSLEMWRQRLERGAATVEAWRWDPMDSAPKAQPLSVPPEQEHLVLPLVLRHRGRSSPVDDQTVVRRDDLLLVAVQGEGRDWLKRGGWCPVEASAQSAPADNFV